MGVDENEQAVLRRSEVEKFFAKLVPARIGIEASGASHHWARVLRGLGHEVVLLPSQSIKPYVKRGKNDAIDAEVICEAMSRPTMRFVPIKSAGQHAALTMLGVRDLLVRQRTMLINAIRGHAAEFGVTAAKGPKQMSELVQRLASDEGVPALAREMVSILAGQLDGLANKMARIVWAMMVSGETYRRPTRARARPPRPGTLETGKDSNSKMAIGRTEDRGIPWNPLVLRHHGPVWDPICVTHLGQRSSNPTTQAGHMTAIDQNHRRCHALARRGPSTCGFSRSRE